MPNRLTDIIRIAKRLLAPLKALQKLKYKKIYGLTYFDKNDVRYLKKVKKDRYTPKRIRAMEQEIGAFNHKPLISVVMPVYDVEQQWLEEAIQSVLQQVYPNWELCIADDASPSPHIKEVLTRYMEQDPRIKVTFLDRNLGISGASNKALALASGQFTALLDHDDVLSRDSLFQVAKQLNHTPEADLVYSDEDKLSMGGMRLRPVIKPDWDPELFLTYNYLCHLVVCRRSLMIEAGGFREGFEGSQDYDLLLRITELTDSERIVHIPRVLYHWRMIPGSAASVVDAKSKAFERAKKALAEAMERRGVRAEIEDGEPAGTFRVRRLD